MTFLRLILRNIAVKPLRTALTALAVSVGVAAGITIGVVTHSLRETAVQVLQIGEADFTVSEEGVSDLLSSAIDEGELDAIGQTAGVDEVTGVLVAPVDLDESNPFFLRIGIDPSAFDAFGVRVVAGRAFGATATDEIMLGFRAAENLDRTVGDTLTIGDDDYEVVGLFSTSQEFGDVASMLPLVTLQAQERKPGDVTLAFVRVDADSDPEEVRRRIEADLPQLVTVRTAEEFGRADRNLALITAADDAATLVTLAFGVLVVTNTMLLTFTERMREFGVLRAVGWSRRRVVAMVIGETLCISVAGAALGVALSFLGVQVLQGVGSLTGVLEPAYTGAVFFRALLTAAGIGFLGALYPALRAASLAPLEALRRE